MKRDDGVSMKLTPEQEAVVSLSSGRHLVLAPPGSGKTEMLSQRILRALDAGVNPNRMLCATFTNRAAFEMRDRVGAESGRSLPDMGNLHHFCHRFLLSVGRLHPGKHVLDEVEQLEFVKEVVDVLREELRDGWSAAGRKHGVFVMRRIAGSDAEDVRKRLSEMLESYIADCREKNVSPYPGLLSGVLTAHQGRVGIPFRYRRKAGFVLLDLAREGVLNALDGAYCGLKRRFRCVDFDDLVNETYLWLDGHPLPDERKFVWVQIDEVQDLNPLQWRIVTELTAADGVSVYFGDVEQAIFSFLGASTASFAEVTDGCKRHYFRTNFRATPILLEILMRYSIDALASDWEFLPSPASAGRADRSGPDGDSRLALSRETSVGSVVSHVDELLASGAAQSVAILVRTNVEADAYEAAVRDSGYRFVKVSGLDLFSYAPMRDFLAFVSLFNGSTTRDGWARLFYRFADGLHSESEARYFVRDLFAAGIDPARVISADGMRLENLFRLPRRMAAYVRRFRALESFRRRLRPALSDSDALSFRKLFRKFEEIALEDDLRYELRELTPGERFAEVDASYRSMARTAAEYACERVERFLRYTDSLYEEDRRPFSSVLAEDWNRLCRLKEADLLVGDEKIVISTVHKAKGRQFDAVVVPNVELMLKAEGVEGTDEARRLLYVAMSRAKRHLSLFGADVGRTEIASFSRCFDAGYRSYYLRRDEALDAKDWLGRWERLARMNESGDCDVAVVDALRDCRVPVMRMALKCCRHLRDVSERRRRLLEPVISRSECCDTALECLRQCREFDDDAIASVRRVALCTRQESVVRAAYEYLYSAVGENRADRSVIGDFLYSRFPRLRLAAASALAEFGDGRWLGHVTGAVSDFDRLATVPDDPSEAPIRAILENRLSDGYETRLRKILYTRAQRRIGNHG